MKLGHAIARAIEPGDLVLLSGGLGAGKTFLARSIVRARGVTADVRVGSPTFALVHEYETTQGRLLHVDLYRLLDGTASIADEVSRLGLREQRADGALLVVEWGETALDSLGGDVSLFVRVEAGATANQREVTLEGARAGALTV